MSEIQDLIDLIEQTPGKPALLRALLRAADAAVDPEPGLAWLGRASPAPYDAALRCDVAALLLDYGRNREALAWTDGPDAILLIARARVLLDMGDESAASDTYVKAIQLDPSLADPELDKRFANRAAAGPAGNVISFRGQRPPLGEGPSPSPLAGAVRRETRTFADVGGLDEVKRDITRRIILPFKKPSLFDKFKRKAGGGVLLYGPPGCGKTMMARATAGEVGAGFISIEIAEILDMYIGQSEKRLASAFQTARASKPSVLFFDEIEALAARRRFGHADHGASLVSTFLNELDGVGADNEGVLVLAATNVPWAIDTAFRRPGRFDRVLFIPPPDKEARLAILALALKDRPQETLSLEPIAQATSGFSGADLVGLIEAACDLAIEESLDSDRVTPLKQKHLNEAARGMKPTTLEWLSQARNYAKYANEGGLYDDVTAFLDKHSK